MKRASAILLALGAAALLLIGLLTLVHARRILAANHAAPSHSLAAHAKSAQDNGDDADDSGVPSVIHFARNPERMPPFLVNDLDGGIISTASLHGKVVLVNFWATWCPPCREEIPELIELSERYKDKLQIIGVSMDDAPASEVRQFAKQIGITYPVVMGSGAIEAEYGGVPALPTSFVISPDGRVVQKHAGLYPIGVYDTEIRSLLGMPVKAKVETFQDVGQIFMRNAANATELPGVDFHGLTATQKHEALKRMNTDLCTCGCKFTIAQCRINDSSCATSKALAAKIVHEIVSAHPAPTTAVAN
ncbi:MAG TPA: TlpA disulfide reductase family protein [Candidatus Acidoferrales bacterium]|nr:TlpA disulfide reductase family protein [Candidatus Acidoferrales bacterium]